jgi:hypothetical protein
MKNLVISSNDTELSGSLSASKEKISELNELYTTQLKEIIKDYQKLGQSLKYRNSAIQILKQRGISELELKMSGYLTNQTYESALRLYIDFNFWNTNYSLWNFYEVKWNEDEGQMVDIYNDKIFCTDQDVDQLNQNDYYKLNKDQFTFYEGFDNTYTVR